MSANQHAYEKGLDNLRLSCDALLDDCKRISRRAKVGSCLKEIDVRNTDSTCDRAYGININKELMPSKASSDDLTKYKLVASGQLAYSSMQTGRDKCIRIALNDMDKTIAVSPAYSVLKGIMDDVDVRYIMLWFSRAESDRYGWFLSDASIRANLDVKRFLDIEIPIPSRDKQKALVDLYASLRMRQNISERLKSQLRDICPVLIRGSIEEATR